MSDADPYLGSHQAHVGIVLSVPTSVPKRGPTDLALQLRVFRAIHLADSACIQGRDDFVYAEAGAGENGDA